MVSDGALQATDPGTVFDSFNSALSTASTGGQYDSAKRLSDGTVLTNGAIIALGGKVYGNVGTNGGTLTRDPSLETGSVNNASYAPLPPVKAPVMPLNLFPYTLTGSENRLAGTSLVPTQYSYTGLSGNLHLTNPTGATGMAAVVYVGGDFTGGIEVDSGITAKVYVTGSMVTSASRLKNDGRLAANLQIYGLPPAAGASPVIRLNADANLVASIYAPGHALSITGNNDVSGALVAASFQTTGAVRVHYDEALALGTGSMPILRYQVASWQEVTN